jgi:hypothetical protein
MKKPLNVAYFFFGSPHQWKIAKRLQSEHNWNPVYWYADISSKKDVESAFADVTFQDTIIGRRAIHTNYLDKIKPQAIDQALLDALSVDQVTAMKIIYRHDGTGYMFNFNEVLEHYYELLSYWLTIIVERKIELVVSWTSPHGMEYVLYMLCKHLSIPWIYIDAGYAITKGTHLIASTIENRAKLLEEKYKVSNNTYLPNSNTLKQIEKQKQDYLTAKPDYMSYPEYFGEKGKWLKKTYQFLRVLAGVVAQGPFKTSGIHFKLKKGSYRDKNTSGNNLQYYFFENRMQRLGKVFKKFYLKYSVKADLSNKFIFFAAPFQPEATTLPDAGAFNYLPLILKMLSAAIPDNWLIYYKEHPATFDAIYSRDLYRSKAYYKEVSEIPKVVMVDYQSDTFQLVDHSQAVATPTGTVGWESIVRQKCVMTFGEAWYNPCDGVFPIKSIQDLNNALELIQSGFKPRYDMILNFAGVVDKYCAKDLKYRNYASRYRNFENLELEIEKFSQAFYYGYELYHSSNAILKD